LGSWYHYCSFTRKHWTSSHFGSTKGQNHCESLHRSWFNAYWITPPSHDVLSYSACFSTIREFGKDGNLTVQGRNQREEAI